MRIPTHSGGYQPTSGTIPGPPPNELAGVRRAQPTVYEGVVFSRELGRGVAVTHAPQHTKLSIGVLLAPGVYLRETVPGHLLLADQVEYVVTGYDAGDCTLTLLLTHDHRPNAATKES